MSVTVIVAAIAAVVVALLTVAVVVLGILLGRARSRLRVVRDRVQQLESHLTTALKPRPAASPAERAVAKVLRTATTTAIRVRQTGLGGLLQSSIEDVTAWAADRRSQITSMAAADGTVTLAFTDIEDSTALNDRLGDRAWVRMLAAHETLVRDRVTTYRGEIVKNSGDGFMLAFRDPEAACRAALGIQRDLRRTLDPRARSLAGVKIRIGIHTGAVISKDGDYFGLNVAMAARIGALAVGGEVLVSEAVHDALDPDAAVVLTDVGEAELKGLPGRHRVWRAEAPS